MNIETQYHCKPWRDGKNSPLKRTFKESSHFNNKNPEELESEFDHFDAVNSYPTLPFKGRNIVDLDFVYNNYLMGINLATPHYL